MKTTCKLYLSVLAAFTVTFAVGCGDGQDVDNGSGTDKPDSATAPDGTAPDAHSDTDASDAAAQPDSSAQKHVITVKLDNNEHNIDLAQLSTKPIKNKQGYQLTDIWVKTGVKASPTQMVFDFVGEDGFHSAKKEKCKNFKAGEKFDYGFVLPLNDPDNPKKLIWDDEKSGAPGCMNVKNLQYIIATLPK